MTEEKDATDLGDGTHLLHLAGGGEVGMEEDGRGDARQWLGATAYGGRSEQEMMRTTTQER
ncbi:hypothetical protein E2562_031824 [Oryza meyeriana var. granulata]|uniref:Uncharacterized protein n=1 Tax=Oryza meyeriana var. granulata TaxID=110450 RepID=A0A6G1CVH7_9ORYZ|nr:hypothetical protein E2562_022650 [Oryza meyeriana var. granulata]KAF0904101.1 hypothetical protein E2562_031824 [Oryza meyeriana var. granulata]